MLAAYYVKNTFQVVNLMFIWNLDGLVRFGKVGLVLKHYNTGLSLPTDLIQFFLQLVDSTTVSGDTVYTLVVNPLLLDNLSADFDNQRHELNTQHYAAIKKVMAATHLFQCRYDTVN